MAATINTPSKCYLWNVIWIWTLDNVHLFSLISEHHNGTLCISHDLWTPIHITIHKYAHFYIHGRVVLFFPCVSSYILIECIKWDKIMAMLQRCRWANWMWGNWKCLVFKVFRNFLKVATNERETHIINKMKKNLFHLYQVYFPCTISNRCTLHISHINAIAFAPRYSLFRLIKYV